MEASATRPGAPRRRRRRPSISSTECRPKTSSTGSGGPNSRSSRRLTSFGDRPLLQHDAVVELPAADQGAGRGVGRRSALVGVERERARAAAAEALPHRCRGLERRHVVHPLRLRRPLERVEQAVVAELHAAVEGVLRTSSEQGGRPRPARAHTPRSRSRARLGSRSSDSRRSRTAVLAASNWRIVSIPTALPGRPRRWVRRHEPRSSWRRRSRP